MTVTDIPFSVLIPARYASRRLPGKPLMEIAGKPMIRHVWERALASGARRVVIATDDRRIADAARGFGADARLTAPQHASGTDRIAEAAAQLGLADDDIVVNLQGDEPQAAPRAIAQVAACLVRHPQAVMSSLYEPLEDARALHDPSVVKVVCDAAGYALYFSRAPIPWSRDEACAGETHDEGQRPGGNGNGVTHRRHLGLYGYRVSYLRLFTALPRTAPERLEKLEQLRALGNGDRIILEPAVEPAGGGVDTASQLAAARRRMGAP